MLIFFIGLIIKQLMLASPFAWNSSVSSPVISMAHQRLKYRTVQRDFKGLYLLLKSSKQRRRKERERICNWTKGRYGLRGTATDTLLCSVRQWWVWVEFQLQATLHFLMFRTSHLKPRINKLKFAYISHLVFPEEHKMAYTISCIGYNVPKT